MKEFTLLGTTLHYSTQRMNYYSMHPVFLARYTFTLCRCSAF